MTGPKQQRVEPRVAVTSAARLHAGDGPALPVALRDVSRSGCRVRLEVSHLGTQLSAGLTRVVEKIRDRLGGGFQVEVAPPLGCHPAQLVRMALPAESTGAVIDLGCLFTEPLSTEKFEAVTKGRASDAAADGAWRRAPIGWDELDRAAVFQASGVASPEQPVARRLMAVSRQRQPARIVAEWARETTAGCRTEILTPHAVLVRLVDAVEDLGLEDRSDLTTIAMAFTARFGERVRLRIGSAAESLWEGGTSVCGFEVHPDHDGDLLVTLTLGRPMDERERARMGF